MTVLVGGWTNLSEKIFVKFRWSPQNKGEKIKKSLKPPPSWCLRSWVIFILHSKSLWSCEEWEKDLCHTPCMPIDLLQASPLVLATLGLCHNPIQSEGFCEITHLNESSKASTLRKTNIALGHVRFYMGNRSWNGPIFQCYRLVFQEYITSWWFQPISKICSSNRIISPGRGEHKKLFETTTT